MAGAKTGAVISMEVFIEQHQLLPVGICLEFGRAAVHGTPVLAITLEDRGQSFGDFSSHFE